MLLRDHVAKVDADAEPDPEVFGHLRLTLGHFTLDLDSTADAIDYARKLCQEAVAGVLYDPAPLLGDLRIDQFPEMGLKPLVRPLLVAPIRREYPATSAARIAVRRRTGGMAGGQGALN